MHDTSPASHRTPSALPRLLLLACCLLLSFATSLRAQTAAPADTDAALDGVRQKIEGAQKAMQDDAADADLLKLRTEMLAAQAQASDIAASLSPQLTAIEARQAELGAAAPGAKEDPDITSQREVLAKARTALDAQVKLSRLLSVESGQVADQVWALRRSQFQARLGERTTSILSRAFWSELRDDAPRDVGRLRALGRELGSSARATPWWGWVGALLAGVLVWPLRARAEGLVMHVITTRVPPARVRRSVYALFVTLLWTFAAGVCVELVHFVLDWDEALAPATRELLGRAAGIFWFGGFVAGLGTALVCAERPSWRLTALPDPVALRMRWFPPRLAAVSIGVWLAERLTVVVDASLAVAVAVNCIAALGLALTLALSLMGAERVWRDEQLREGAPRRPVWRVVAAAVAWLLLVGCTISLLAGYVALGSFVVKQLFWGTVVIGTLFLLASAIDDACMTWVATRPHDAEGQPAAATRARDQAAVLLSALARLALMLVAAMLLLAPFGEGPGDLWRRSGQLQQGLAIGEVQIRPGAILQAMVVLVLSLVAVRLLRNWLTKRYLPTTSLDAGMRVSASTLFGYAGVVTAWAVAMSAVGIGLERIAWVASALSVGIGFGLQAVVQNFVSGLILLAERPVKVGDWVSLGGIEGDIRRINVRATEIQMGDRSTVIVPNSEFITKVVRNVTLADPLGLVQVKLPVPLATDPQQVRELLLAAFTANTDVLDSPAPGVLLDGVDGGTMMFNATGFVASPRMTGGVRSALLFDVLQRLQSAGITLVAPPTMVLGMPPPASSTGPALPPLGTPSAAT